jgi:hypothetical protein
MKKKVVKKTMKRSSVADPRYLCRIQDSGSEFFHPGSRVKEIPDPGSGSASKNLSIFNPKNCF